MSETRSPELFGSHWVTPTGTALNRAWKLFQGRAGPYFELRRHVLKLAYFPSGSVDSQVVDIDWDWITGTGEEGIGELRISDVIGGQDNLRVIFFLANQVRSNEPLPRIWILTVLQKKNQRFSPNELRTFAAAKKLIILRHYGFK
ncbi:MAG: hypothetical protein U0795_26405 [Pirellulales bacterium]